MLFKPELIKKIVEEKKTQTRRLVKESEVYIRASPTDNKNSPIIKVMSSPFDVKWQIGKDYAVQPGRGKKGVSYPHPCNGFITPLRIRITEIRKEKFQDITNEGAIKEGFESRLDFLIYFCEINGKKYSEDFPEWNPDVWVLTFDVPSLFRAFR